MMWKNPFKKSNPKPLKPGEYDRPPVYVSPKGARYVKAHELLGSRRARSVIDQMADLTPKQVTDLANNLGIEERPVKK